MPEIRSTTLPNGLVILTERLPGVRSAGLTWILPFGTAREPEDRLGLCSFTADMLLRGSTTHTSRQQADAFDRLGVSRNTSPETFTLSVKGTMLGARLHDALPLFVDMVCAPAFADEHIEPVRDLALQAIASLRDDPQERVMLALRRHHAASPIHRDTYGNARSVAAISKVDLTNAWSSAAVPQGSVFAAAGDVDHDALVEDLTKRLDGWSGSPETPLVDPVGDRGMHHEEAETDQTHIGLCYDAPAEGTEESWLERCATAVLSGGMSSRLFTEVREKRSLVYSVYASYGADAEYGRTVCYAGTTPERAQETVDVLTGELERIRTEVGKVTQEEFDRAMVGLKARLVFAGESSSARASAMAHDQRKLGRARTLDELAGSFDAVTLDRLNAYLLDRPLGVTTLASVGPVPLTAAAHS